MHRYYFAIHAIAKRFILNLLLDCETENHWLCQWIKSFNNGEKPSVSVDVNAGFAKKEKCKVWLRMFKVELVDFNCTMGDN